MKETFVRSHDGDVDNIVLKARLSPMSSVHVEDVDVGGEKDDKEKDTDLPLVLMMGVIMVTMMVISQYNLCLSSPGLPLADLVEHLLDFEAAPPHSLKTRFL